MKELEAVSIDDLILEISYQTSDGIVDFSKLEHCDLLAGILNSRGIERTIIDEIVEDVHRIARIKLEEGSKASADAHKKGLESMGWGKWKKRGDKKNKVVAVTDQDKDKLVMVSKGKTKKSPSKSSKKPPTKSSAKTKTPTTKKPSVVPDKQSTQTQPFLQSSEISQGLFHADYGKVTEPSGKSVEVRQLVDESGSVVDVTTPDGVKRANQLLQRRLEKMRPQIIQAAQLLSDDKQLSAFRKAHEGVKKEHIQKWVGEIGEIKSLQELLANGARAYMLTASAPKNDLVAFVGDMERGLKMAFYSVKSTKEGEEPNQLGANVRKDMLSFLNDVDEPEIDVTVGDKSYKVDSRDYMNLTMSMKNALMNMISIGGVGRDGIDVSTYDKTDFFPGYEKVLQKLKGNRTGFKRQSDFLKYRKVTAQDIEKTFSNPNIDKKVISLYKKYAIPVNDYGATKELLKQQLLTRASSKPMNGEELSSWLEGNFAEVMDKTKAVARPTADLIAFHMNTETGYNESSIGIITAEDAKDEYQKRYGDLSVLDGLGQVKKVIGLSQRTRGVGKVKDGTGYIDGINNSVPTVKLIHREQGISEYINQLKRRQTENP